ncbi:AP-4 complex accessory subunit RUSC2 isoform X1 [Anolis sagrei]|uniref:AP-4 complex accessory subunit RUSC2 isoform X1 n=1 Tax=Anolis sagrei TaxID=38937 RepID=UPI00352045F5
MMMDSPPKLSGETLIVHHIPLVHCQVPDRQCKRSNPFGQPDLGPLRTAPLPEQDFLQSDSLARLRRIPSDPTEPVPPLETPPEEGQAWDPGASRRQNPFLLSEDEEPPEDEGPLGQRSFRLHSHGQPAFHLHSELSLPPFRLHNAGHGVKPWGSAAVAGQRSDGQEDRGKKRRPESMELDEYSCHRERDPSDSSSEQDWAADPDSDLGPGPEAPRSRTCSCSSGSEIQRCRCCSLSSQSEPLDHQMGYASDSSCNSSDGVLVNFSTLYHKMNGHPPNLNSCEEESSSGGSHSDTGGGGAFYLDLHSSPQEAKLRCPEPLGTACPCHGPSSPVLDANCNSYDPCGSGGSSSDLTACFQSQARLVVATQNYYKLVTCDLSSQSSPSPAGSSITSCSEEQARVSSPPLQPTEYYLFQRPAESGGDEPQSLEAGDAAEPNANTVEGQLYVNISPPTLATGRQRSRSYDRNLDRSPSAAGRLGSLERMMSCPVKLSEGPHSLTLQSSPPKRVTSFAELAKGRKKNGSGGSSSSSSGNNNCSSGCSPPFRASRDSSLEFSPIPEHRRGGSGGGGGSGSVFLEDRAPRHSQSLPPMPWIHSLQRSPEEEEDDDEGHGSRPQDTPPCGQQSFFPTLAEAGGLGQKDVRARADGGAADGKVFRYSKDQRPTTLPIQPFVFQHHFPRQPKARALQSHLAASLSQLYSRSSSAGRCAAAHQPPSAASTSAADQPMPQRSADGATCPKKPPPVVAVAPETTRPSPLGSYSPIRSHGGPFFQSNAGDSSSSSSSSSSVSLPTPDGHPPRSRSCPASANLLPVTSVAGPSPAAAGHNAKEEGPAPLSRKDAAPEFELGEVGSLPPLILAGGLGLARAGAPHPEAQWKAGCGEALVGVGPVGTVLSRPLNAHHLSPQALKWREYRRRNPLGLGLDRGSSGASASGLDGKQVPPEPEGRLSRRNPLFELPGALGGGRPYARLNGHSVKQLQLNYSDFFPDYFSLAEKPPAEFCLSPDGNTESISIDLLQKKGLVKAVNMAVDLIVAHFGTSRDPGVKAKLGNSSVSPNVGHLILKYLCPAIREVLSDGLKAYVLDVIIGQRRNVPWSVVEASTQLGPSTKVLHGLYSKVSQYPELTSHTMRFNAFIFGLLNIRSLEFWFNHLYNHEDVLQAHYQPVGFLALSQGVCQGLFEELLLLLQPLSLLPFDLDLLFEHHRLQMGREQRQKKELLRIRQDLLLSAHSTLQLMRTPGQSGAPDEEEEEEEEEDPQQRRSSSGSNTLGWGPKKTPKRQEEEEEAAPVQRVKGVGAPSGGKSEEEVARRQWPEGPPGPKRDKQASWWFQLMQSSQVYIEGPSEGPRAIRYERKVKKPAPTTKKVPPPPPREGVVEGAEACPIAAEVPLKDRPSLGPTVGAPQKPEFPEKEEEKGPHHRRPSWMGSPPESVLTELKHSKAKEEEEGPQKLGSPLKESGPGVSLSNQPKWGCLFGSRKAPKDSKQTPNRLPSGWLSLDRSIFQLVAQTVGAASGVWREAHADPEKLAPELPPLHPKHRTPLLLLPPDRSKAQEGPCQVKALCHHIATEAGQLSFQKGDLLRVLGKADADWLRCGRGAESGLVPVMYVTHAEDQDY